MPTVDNIVTPAIAERLIQLGTLNGNRFTPGRLFTPVVAASVINRYVEEPFMERYPSVNWDYYDYITGPYIHSFLLRSNEYYRSATEGEKWQILIQSFRQIVEDQVSFLIRKTNDGTNAVRNAVDILNNIPTQGPRSQATMLTLQPRALPAAPPPPVAAARGPGLTRQNAILPQGFELAAPAEEIRGPAATPAPTPTVPAAPQGAQGAPPAPAQRSRGRAYRFNEDDYPSEESIGPAATPAEEIRGPAATPAGEPLTLEQINEIIRVYSVLSGDDIPVREFYEEQASGYGYRQTFIIRTADNRFSGESIDRPGGGEGREFVECMDNTPQDQGFLGAAYVRYIKPNGRHFIKMDINNVPSLVVKPDWWDTNVVPAGTKYFNAVPDGSALFFMSMNFASMNFPPGFNATGTEHCQQETRQNVYRLEPIDLPELRTYANQFGEQNAGYKRRASKKNKRNTLKKNKRNTLKKNKRITLKKNKRNALKKNKRNTLKNIKKI